MATYTVRGTSHNIIYWCDFPEGRKQQWETYATELEARQRKTYIDYLQKSKRMDKLIEAAVEYREMRSAERAVLESKNQAKVISEVTASDIVVSSEEDNTDKTYREFAEKWLPFQARKKRFSPNTYDSWLCILRVHIFPYFGDRIMSTIRAEEIDDFVDYLSRKPCKGSKSYNKSPDCVPTLSSGTVKKCYTVFTSGFRVAKKWRYIREIPESTAPAEKWKKRKAWDAAQVYSALTGMKEDKLLHLMVHMAFVCSLRAGETAGIDMNTINFQDRSLWIAQQIQRVSDDSLDVLPKNEVIRIFPKSSPTAKSHLILKAPKTEGSYRKQYLTMPLLQEIRERQAEISRNKEFFGTEYQDYGLLFCKPTGDPLDPDTFSTWFKRWQREHGIKDQIEFQGLRKSGQMHKVRLTKNNYQLVAENSGQSPEVLMSNYNEALDSEKRTLSQLVEASFYPHDASAFPPKDEKVEAVLQAIRKNPELSNQILQLLLANAANAS